MAVLDCAAVVGAYYAAGITVAGDAGVGEEEVLHGAAAHVAEEALIFPVVSKGVWDTYAYAADGVVVAVEESSEGVAFSAYGGEVVLCAGNIVPIGGMGVGDVAIEAVVTGGVGLVVAVRLVVVDAVGEHVKLMYTGDDIGGVLGAAAAPYGSDDRRHNSSIGRGHLESIAGDADRAALCVGGRVGDVVVVVGNGAGVADSDGGSGQEIVCCVVCKRWCGGNRDVGAGDSAHGHGTVVCGDIGAVAADICGVATNHTLGIAVVGQCNEVACVADDGTLVVGDIGNGDTKGTVVLECAAFANDAAEIHAVCQAVGDGESCVTDAPRHATVIVAHNAAVKSAAGGYGMHSHVVHNCAARHLAAAVACNGTHPVLAGNSGVGKLEVEDMAVVANGAEETFSLVVAGVIDADAADSMLLSVEGALEPEIVTRTRTDGVEVVFGAFGVPCG